ncbi:MAG TPA: hypothetical protein VJJ27_01190, partial [Candidatus Paceibacterota bacterium]
MKIKKTKAFCIVLFCVGLLLLFSEIVFFETAQAAVPTILSYQGRLTDASGNLLGGSSGTTHYFKFSIWTTSATTTGSRLWPSSAPTSFSTTVKQGVFTVNIGDTTNGYPDALDYIFDSTTVYLQVEVSSNGSTFETVSPRQQITSNAFSQVAAAVSGTRQSAIGTTTPASNTVLTVEATTTTATPLLIRAVASQSANLFDIKNSIGSSLFFVNNLGGFLTNSSSTITNLSSVYSTTTAATTTNLAVTGTATSTFNAGIQTPYLNVTGTSATSTFSNGIDLAAGCLRVNGNCVTGGLSSIGPAGQLQSGSSQTLATSSDTNIGLTITASGDTQTFTSNWIGTLAANRGGTGISSYATGDILYATGATTLSKLPIGSPGQVLKITGGSLPAWGTDTVGG